MEAVSFHEKKFNLIFLFVTIVYFDFTNYLQVVGAVEAEIVMAAEDEPRQEVLQDAEVVQGVEVVRDVQEPAVLQVIDLCPEVAGIIQFGNFREKRKSVYYVR